MNGTSPRRSHPALSIFIVLMVACSILATAVLAAELVPPRPVPHKPVGGTLNIAYMREVSSPDGFQADGSFDRMYFFTGNEVLAAIGKDSLYDPAESLAYAYDVLDDGKRYRFYLRQGVQFQGGYGEMTAADVAWSLNRIHRPDMGSRWSNIFRAMDRAEEVDRYTVDVYLKELDVNLIPRMFDRQGDRALAQTLGGSGGTRRAQAAAHQHWPLSTGGLESWGGDGMGEAPAVLAWGTDDGPRQRQGHHREPRSFGGLADRRGAGGVAAGRAGAGRHKKTPTSRCGPALAWVGTAGPGRSVCRRSMIFGCAGP